MGVLKNKDLLSIENRVQVPWVKVTIGDFYTFGVYTQNTYNLMLGNETIYKEVFGIEYPNYVQNLKVTKINGQVNRYTLGISYAITQFDDPNFFEKVFSRASGARKIVFSYGDINQPGFIYRNEEAIITKVMQSFSLESSRIEYTIEAVSSASLQTTGRENFISDGAEVKPSTLIKEKFLQDASLRNVFTGMSADNLDDYIAGDDQAVKIPSQKNLSALDLISYLVGCMRPADAPKGLPTANYVMTIHDNAGTLNEKGEIEGSGPYFKVEKIDKNIERPDAYTITVGYNTREIVTNFQIENNENYALLFDYQNEINPKKYVRRLNKQGQWEDEYCPIMTSNNTTGQSTISDENWWNLITQYPINASITILGLLRPATLMQYVRLNVVFPGGHKHISSGLYLVTKQEDAIDSNGYRTTLGLTKIAGDADIVTGSGITNFRQNK